MSKSFDISKREVVKWLDNQKLFLLPLVVIYVSFVMANIEGDGFSLTDFIPSSVVIGSMVLYVLNSILDFARKYVPKTK